MEEQTITAEITSLATDVKLAGQLDSWTAGHIWLAFPFLGYFLIIVRGAEGEAPRI